MTLAPLLSAPLAIQVHVFTVVPAAVLGGYLLLARKGTARHRLLGRIWIALMVVTALSSFFIHAIRMIGPFSPIHLLSLITLAGCAQAVRAARRRDLPAHRRAVIGTYAGGIGIAGLFTLLPGRIMHAVFFDGSGSLLPVAVLAGALLAAFAMRRGSRLKIGS